MGLPYVHIPPLHLGTIPEGVPLLGGSPVDIQPFGVLLAGGVVLASWMGRRYAERRGLDDDDFTWLSIRVLILGFVGCHVLNVVFYDYPRLLGWEPLFGGVPGSGVAGGRDHPRDLALLLRIWDGISSWGGVVGGALAFYVLAGMRKLPRLVWADLMAWCAIGGWVPGRAACAVAHDHTGGPTSFFLGVDVPSPPPPHTPGLVARYAGQTIHDLGLYELLFLLPILGVMFVAQRRTDRKPGTLLGLLATLYSVPRFFLDFLRQPETDPRFAGLTFAQYCCIVALALGVFLLLRREKEI